MFLRFRVSVPVFEITGADSWYNFGPKRMAFSRFGRHLMTRILAPAVALTLGASVAASAQTAPTPGPQSLITRTCAGCHNERTKSGGLSLQGFEVATAEQHAEVAEKMIRKLRAGQMPPPGLSLIHI